MKRLLCLMLVTVMLLSLCACGNDTPASDSPANTDSAPALTTPDADPTTDTVTEPTTPATKPSPTPEPVSTTTQPSDPPVVEPTEPTQEELDAMWEYAHIAVALEEYLTNGYIIYSINNDDGSVVQTLRGQEALAYCYQQLIAMESIDRWLGTEFSEDIHWHDVTPNWNRTELLGKFHVLNDLKLRQDYVLTKSDSTTESGTESAWSYDSNAALTSIDGIAHVFETIQSVPVFPGNFTVYLSYNTDGTYSQILYGSNAYATGIPTYDENGNISSISVTSRDDSCVVEYTYTGELLTKIEWTEYGYPVEIEYTYDGSGNVIKSVYTEYVGTDNLGNNLYSHQRIIFDYTYSGNQLLSAKRTEEVWSWEWDADLNYIFFVEVEIIDHYSFTYDEQGRLAAADIVYGDTMWAHGEKAGTLCRESENQSKHIDLIYGDYCFYLD